MYWGTWCWRGISSAPCSRHQHQRSLQNGFRFDEQFCAGLFPILKTCLNSAAMPSLHPPLSCTTKTTIIVFCVSMLLTMQNEWTFQVDFFMMMAGNFYGHLVQNWKTSWKCWKCVSPSWYEKNGQSIFSECCKMQYWQPLYSPLTDLSFWDAAWPTSGLQGGHFVSSYNLSTEYGEVSSIARSIARTRSTNRARADCVWNRLRPLFLGSKLTEKKGRRIMPVQ